MGGEATPKVARSFLTQRFPRHLKQSFARGGISCSEISDAGQDDTDRIATFDVARLLVPMRNRQSKKYGISGGKRCSLAEREDCGRAATSLDLPDSLLVRRVNSHRSAQPRKSEIVVDCRLCTGALAHAEIAGQPRRHVDDAPVRAGWAPGSTSSPCPRARVNEVWIADGFTVNRATERERGGPRRADPCTSIAVMAINSDCRRHRRRNLRLHHDRRRNRHHRRRYEVREAWLH